MIIQAFDSLEFNREWQEVSKKEKNDPAGKAYLKIKYQTNPAYRHGLSWRIATLFSALIETVTILPLFNQRKALCKQWVSGFTGIEERVIRVYKQANVLPASPEKPAPLFAKAEGLIDPKKPPSLEQVRAQEVIELQAKIQLNNPHHPLLNLRELDKELFPFHKLVLGEVEYYVSKPFNVTGNNAGVLLLVKIQDKVFPQVAYKSNSQATWRVMPAAQKGLFGLGRLGKGLEESDTELPISLNICLHSLMPQVTIPDVRLIQDNIKSGWDKTPSYTEHVQMVSFCSLVDGAEAAFYKAGMNVPRPPKPEAILLPRNKEHLPNFERLIWTKEFEDRNYGKITAKVFASKDESIQYLFYELEDGRAYLASAEKVKDNPINYYGIRRSALKQNASDLPILEYPQQIPPGFEPKADAPRYNSTRYSNNWNFVRELEMIKLYYTDQKKTLPPKV